MSGEPEGRSGEEEFASALGEIAAEMRAAAPPAEEPKREPISVFKGRMAHQARQEEREELRARREAFQDPDPAVADPLRELLGQRKARQRLLHRHRRRTRR